MPKNPYPPVVRTNDQTEPCEDSRCTRLEGKCVGIHCSLCGESSSSQGHMHCQRAKERHDCFNEGDAARAAWFLAALREPDEELAAFGAAALKPLADENRDHSAAAAVFKIAAHVLSERLGGEA